MDAEKEATRIVSNMSSMAGYNGTTTAEVVDAICRRFSDKLFCYGQLRRMVFTPITQNTIAFRTEAVS